MNLLQNLSKITAISLAISSSLLTGCDSDNNSAELSKSVKLEEQRTKGTIIESVNITNAQIRLKADEKHQLTATGTDSKGEKRDITNELTWTSSDETIATVSSKGLVTAVANSDVNQGIIIITGTTDNDVVGEGEISVSDIRVSAITLKQTTPATGHINTCIDASIKGDVSYEDGYISLNTVKDMAFSLDDNSTAVITKDGTLYTSAEGMENSTITSTIPSKNGNISAQLTVTSDPKNLDTIDILRDDEVITEIELTIGDRIQVNAQGKLIDTISKDFVDIDPSITWQQSDAGLTGITAAGEKKGTILALKAGVTELIGTCGGKDAKAILEVKGEAKLESTMINEGEDIITLAPLKSVELTLTASYDITPTSLNISEFAKWNIIGSDIVKIELMSSGTDKAHYKLTSTSANTGSVVLLATYGSIVSKVSIDIENK